MEIPTEPPIADPHTDGKLQGNLLQNYERISEQQSDDQKLSKLCSDAGLKSVEKGHFFITLDEEEGPDEMKNLCRDYTLPRSEEASRVRVDSWKHENRPGLGCEGLLSSRTLQYRNHGRIPVLRQNSFLGSNCEWN